MSWDSVLSDEERTAAWSDSMELLFGYFATTGSLSTVEVAAGLGTEPDEELRGVFVEGRFRFLLAAAAALYKLTEDLEPYLARNQTRIHEGAVGHIRGRLDLNRYLVMRQRHS